MDSKSTSPVEIINSVSVISIARQSLRCYLSFPPKRGGKKPASDKNSLVRILFFSFGQARTVRRIQVQPTENAEHQPVTNLVKYQPRSQGFKQGCV